MAAPLLMMCLKLRNLRVNCSLQNGNNLTFVLVVVAHCKMHNICLFECQLVLTNDVELTRSYDIHVHQHSNAVILTDLLQILCHVSK